MIRNPIDVAARVSPELSRLVVNFIDRLESGEPVTLGTLRTFIGRKLSAEYGESEEMHRFDTDESLLDELDELIEQYGESAAAEDFVRVCASEALTRAIEEVLNDENREYTATLAAVREALDSGLGSRMVGEGVLEEDEADMLVPELESLIDRYGEEAAAEEFLRYE